MLLFKEINEHKSDADHVEFPKLQTSGMQEIENPTRFRQTKTKLTPREGKIKIKDPNKTLSDTEVD